MANEVRLSPDFNRDLVRAILPQLRQTRDDIEREMKRRVPVDTGELRDSIFVELDEETGNITAGATAKHAPAVELGHVTEAGTEVAPQPFIRPAFSKRRS